MHWKLQNTIKKINDLSKWRCIVCSCTGHRTLEYYDVDSSQVDPQIQYIQNNTGFNYKVDFKIYMGK